MNLRFKQINKLMLVVWLTVGLFAAYSCAIDLSIETPQGPKGDQGIKHKLARFPPHKTAVPCPWHNPVGNPNRDGGQNA